MSRLPSFGLPYGCMSIPAHFFVAAPLGCASLWVGPQALFRPLATAFRQHIWPCLVVGFAPTSWLTIRPGPQRLGLCSGGYFSPASKLDAGCTFGNGALFHSHASMSASSIRNHAYRHETVKVSGLPRSVGEFPLLSLSDFSRSSAGTAGGFKLLGGAVLGGTLLSGSAISTWQVVQTGFNWRG